MFTLSAYAVDRTFAAGQFNLAPNQSVVVSKTTLVFQTDGNLVAYAGGSPVWASNSFASCSSVCVAAFQTDGNLVLYHAGKAYWSTQTYNHPTAQLILSTSAPVLQIVVNKTQLWPAGASSAPPSSNCPTISCYYIDSVAGSDANTGVMSSYAWKSLANLSKAAIAPGTSILLKRGSQFAGEQITIKASGTASNPIVVDAYGTGPLPLLSGGAYGVLGQNVSNISVSNLNISGVSDTAVLGSGNQAEFWTVANCTISGTGTSGIQARPDWTNATPLRGWVVQGNTVGVVNTPPLLNYDKAGILMQGTAGAIVSRNTVAAINTTGIRVGSYQGAQSQNTTVSYNEVTLNQGGISVRDTLNALVTHNWIHDGKGFAIGIGGAVDSQGAYSSYNNILTYNVAQNMKRSDDGLLYNGFDINSSANGKIYQNTIENVSAHSITLEGDEGPANNWIVKNNIIDARRQGSSQDDNCFLFRLVNVQSESLGNNLLMGNLNWLDIVGTDMDATSDLAIWNIPAWLALGIDTNSLYNQDPQFISVTGENLALQAGSYARNLATPILGIGQVSLDAGALPYGQTNVLAF